jgi:hypothetical protein
MTPLSRPLPPNRRKAADLGGEEIILVELLTQGGARGSCPSLALWASFRRPGAQRTQRHPAAALLEK